MVNFATADGKQTGKSFFETKSYSTVISRIKVKDRLNADQSSRAWPPSAAKIFRNVSELNVK
jgi:hypothetical protein